MTVTIKRVIKGKSPFYGDKTHFHHTLVRFGFDKKRAVKIILSLSAVLSLSGIMGTVFQIPEYYLFSLFIVYSAFYILSANYAKDILRMRLRFKKKTLDKDTGSILTVKLSQVLDKATKVKRKYERYLVTRPFLCSVKLDGHFVSGVVIDLGLGGFSACLKETILVGEEAEVDFSLDKEDKQSRCSLPTEIVWSFQSNGGYKSGFKFVDLNGSQAEILKDYLGAIANKEGDLKYEHIYA